MNNKKIFAFDVDGVLLNFHDTWLNFAEKILKRKITIISKGSYNFIDRFDISKKELFKVLACFSDNGEWEKIIVIEESFKFIQKILHAGHEVHFITSIPEEVRLYRENQLKKMFTQKYNKQVFLHVSKTDFVIFSNSKTKYEHLKCIDPCLYVDDLYFHCEEAYNAGVKQVYFMKSIHNGGERTDSSNNFITIENLFEISNYSDEDFS